MDNITSNVCKGCQQGTCTMDTRDSWEGDPICKTCGEEMEMSEVHEGYVCLKDHLKEEKDMHVCKGKCWYGLCPDLGD